jgi:hypothetical protein
MKYLKVGDRKSDLQAARRSAADRYTMNCEVTEQDNIFVIKRGQREGEVCTVEQTKLHLLASLEKCPLSLSSLDLETLPSDLHLL